MVPLIFGDFRVLPLPTTAPMLCALCKAPRAHWMMFTASGAGRQAVCGVCLLYETSWGQAYAEEIAAYIERVNEARRAAHSRAFELVEGRVESDGADVLVGGIYTATRQRESLRRTTGGER